MEGLKSRLDKVQEAINGIEIREQEHREAEAERDERISRNETTVEGFKSRLDEVEETVSGIEIREQEYREAVAGETKQSARMKEY